MFPEFESLQAYGTTVVPPHRPRFSTREDLGTHSSRSFHEGPCSVSGIFGNFSTCRASLPICAHEQAGRISTFTISIRSWAHLCHAGSPICELPIWNETGSQPTPGTPTYTSPHQRSWPIPVIPTIICHGTGRLADLFITSLCTELPGSCSPRQGESSDVRENQGDGTRVTR